MSSGVGVDFSFVIPLYRTGSQVEKLLREFACLRIPESFELVLVDDGSDDDTPSHVLRVAATMSGSVLLAQLGRNCGESAAVLQGLGLVRGEWIATLDDDLQTPLDDALRMLRRLRDSDGQLDVVYAARVGGCDRNWMRRLGSGLHQWVLRLFIPGLPKVEINSFRALSRSVAKRLLQCGESKPLHLDRLLLGLTRRIANEPVRYAAGIFAASRHNLVRLLAMLHEVCVLSSPRWWHLSVFMSLCGALLLVAGISSRGWPLGLGCGLVVVGWSLGLDALMLAHQRHWGSSRVWVRSLTQLGGSWS